MIAAQLTEHIPELRMLVTGGSGFLGAYTDYVFCPKDIIDLSDRVHFVMQQLACYYS
jgi:hypothetical protein